MPETITLFSKTTLTHPHHHSITITLRVPSVTEVSAHEAATLANAMPGVATTEQMCELVEACTVSGEWSHVVLADGEPATFRDLGLDFVKDCYAELSKRARGKSTWRESQTTAG